MFLNKARGTVLPPSRAHLLTLDSPIPNVERSRQSRDWLCTLHVSEPPTLPPPADLPETIIFACGQLERAPTTGQLHWQFYVHLETKRRMGGVKSILVAWMGDHANSTHLEPMRGTRQQCIEYCQKPDSYESHRFSYGPVPVRQRRGDELLSFFRTGGKLLSMANDPSWDDMLLRFSRSRLLDLSSLVSPQQRDPSGPFLCEVHYGPPGTGKSRRVFSGFPEAYIKPSGKWWDHYDGQTTVIMDDFDGSFLSFGDFKRIVDRYPTYVEIKGGVVPLLASHFVLTTNANPSNWWSKSVTGGDGRDAIWRRITRVFYYSSLDEPVELDGSTFRASYRYLEGDDQ